MSSLLHVSLCIMCVPGAHGSRKRLLGSLKLELQMVVGHNVSAGTGLGFSVNVTNTLNFWAISPPPGTGFKLCPFLRLIEHISLHKKKNSMGNEALLFSSLLFLALNRFSNTTWELNTEKWCFSRWWQFEKTISPCKQLRNLKMELCLSKQPWGTESSFS